MKSKRLFIGPRSPLRLARIHPYALYEAFGIPSQLWLGALTRQVAANDDERATIARYLSPA